MPSAVIDTPIGPLGLEAENDALTRIVFHAERPNGHGRLTGVLDDAARQLDAYFGGTLQLFDLPIAMRGTPFQLAVWRALQQIPFGTTCSYADLASRIGRPSAVRAVGAANGQNPLPIVVPCHRVIGSNGRLVGFGGGIETKRQLLQLEADVAAGL